MTRVKDSATPVREETTMAYENDNIQVPATEQNAQIEEISLQMEELESRVAPSTVWGS